jgi:hypothetical protein
MGRRDGPARRGLTTVEMLVALIVAVVALIGVSAFMNASWRAYQNLIWQNKVNQEARQALDAICDMVRMAGNDRDVLMPISLSNQVLTGSAEGVLVVSPISGIGNVRYEQQTQSGTGIGYLTRTLGAETIASAQFVTQVRFEYEYRLPATTTQGKPTWTMVRVSNPAAVSANPLVRTVYIIVTTTARPDPIGPTYTRTLSSAVQLRGPYNAALPPAQSF